MRILLTGATGFVGRPLTRALVNAGHVVFAAGPRAAASQLPDGVNVVSAFDLARPTDWTPLLAGIDTVVHLAGIAHVGPGVSAEMYDRINRQGTATLARSAARAGVAKFIFVSSIRAQTGPSADHILSEDDEPVPTDNYGRSKLEAEHAVRDAGVPFTIFRPVVIYGPGMKGNLAALRRFARLPLPLPFAAFENRRSLLSVDAMVCAILFALDKRTISGSTYIVADTQPVTLAQIIASLSVAAGRAPWLFALPPGLFRMAAQTIGRSDLWDRVGGELTASPARLIAAGWSPESDTCAALARLTAASTGLHEDD